MSFAEPILLAGFILIPLAMLAYGSLQRRRRRESAAWANPALVPNLTTARPGWRRHLPPFLLLLALAIARRRAGAAAADRRGAAARGQRDHGHRHLGLDERDRRPARPADARPSTAAKTLTEKVPETFRLGLVTFSDYAEQRVAPTTDRAQIRGALDQLVAEGGTAMGDGLERGLFAARTPVPNANGTGVRRLPSVIVLLSDGKNTSGTRDPVEVAREAGPRPDPDLRDRARHGRAARSSCATRSASSSASRCRRTPRRSRRSRAISGGKSYTATETDKVKEIYANLGTRLSSRSEKREVTASFAGGALFLLFAAGGLSLRWFGRLI